MDATRRRFVDGLYVRSREHDAALSDRLERFRNVEPPTAELLGVLIRATGARRILVELRIEDAAETIARSDDGEWEFVFLDAEPALTQAVVPVGAGLRLAVRDS